MNQGKYLIPIFLEKKTGKNCGIESPEGNYISHFTPLAKNLKNTRLRLVFFIFQIGKIWRSGMSSLNDNGKIQQNYVRG